MNLIRSAWFKVLWASLFFVSAVVGDPRDTHADTSVGSCFWTVKMDPSVVNVAFPDTNVIYYMGLYHLAQGDSLTIRGKFPYARYMSFNVYDPLGQPIDALADYQIRPDPGSGNPYLKNADPHLSPRNYTVKVRYGPKPANPEPNTLYTGTNARGLPNVAGLIIYRIYVPSKGKGETGGVPLPAVTINHRGEAVNFSDCKPLHPRLPDVNPLLRDASYPSWLPAPLKHPGPNPPRWAKFFGFDQSVVHWLLVNGYTGDAGVRLVTKYPRLTDAGFISDRNNQYIYTGINRSYGRLFVIRAKAPTFPDTYNGQKITGKEQVRYWSVCQTEFVTQRYVDCLRDDRMVVDEQGYFTLVISDPSERPANATKEHGVNWLPWGVYYDGVVIYRQLLAHDRFKEAIRHIPENQPVENYMGDYYPQATYCSKREFEQSRCGIGK